MITTPVAFIALFLLIRQSLGRLWHSANAMRAGRTGGRADAASGCLSSAAMQFPVASL